MNLLEISRMAEENEGYQLVLGALHGPLEHILTPAKLLLGSHWLMSRIGQSKTAKEEDINWVTKVVTPETDKQEMFMVT